MLTQRHVLVVGRFPPPLDGQAIATRRLAELLEPHCDLTRVDLSSGATDLAESSVKLRTGRIRHYLGTRRAIRAAVAANRGAAVLWPGISGSSLGHLRDSLATLPALADASRIHAVVHWGNFDQIFRRPQTQYLAQRMVKQLASVVFLNQLLRDRCADFVLDSKAKIIPNTIDSSLQLTEPEVDAKQKSRSNREEFRMLYLGSMTPSKGWADAVSATRQLREDGHNVVLDLVGRWESDDDRTQFTDELVTDGLSDFIVHHGALSDRSTIKSMYLNSDAFLLPTYYPTEAQPLTIIEAMNAGTPVISTRHAGIPEMMSNGQEGYLVDQTSPEQIAHAVEKLLPYDHWLERSRAARSRFVATFHPDRITEKWLEIVNT